MVHRRVFIKSRTPIRLACLINQDKLSNVSIAETNYSKDTIPSEAK